MSELLVGSFTTILGGWFGYYLGHLKDAQGRKDRRAVLATSLLVELRGLNGALRQVSDGGVPYGDPFRHPVLDAALRDLSLFDREAAVALAHFRVLLLDVQHDVRTAHAIQRGEAQGQAFYNLNASVKVKATYAANAIKDLKEALLTSGGALPPLIQERPATADEPPKPLPSPFELFESPGAAKENASRSEKPRS